MLNKDFYDKWYADRITADLQRERIISKHFKEVKGMKAYLFLPTGERREPQGREWYYAPALGWTNLITRQHCDIYTRHEVEVPEGSYFAEIGFTGYSNTVYIPLSPKPKPKVKKWKWIVGIYAPDCTHMFTHYHTEEEIKAEYPCAEWYHKIDETEVKG